MRDRRIVTACLVLFAVGCNTSDPPPNESATDSGGVVSDSNVPTPETGGSETAGTCKLAAPELAAATWPMPGSTAAGGVNPPKLTTNADTVTDEITGLTWERALDATRPSQAAAITRCEELTLGGFSDWRLPSRIEMVSILDIDTFLGWNDTAFPKASSGGFYWTMSSNPDPTRCDDLRFGVSAYLTSPTVSAKLDKATTRCVRRATPAVLPAKRYDVGEETVTDNGTKLVWQKALPGVTVDQTTALATCAKLVIAGGGFRLPTWKELQTTFDEHHFDPSVDPDAFPGMPKEAILWSSTFNHNQRADGLLRLEFKTGTTLIGGGPGKAFVRCVK